MWSDRPLGAIEETETKAIQVDRHLCIAGLQGYGRDRLGTQGSRENRRHKEDKRDGKTKPFHLGRSILVLPGSGSPRKGQIPNLYNR